MIGFGGATLPESLVTAVLIIAFGVSSMYFFGLGLYAGVTVGMVGMLVVHAVWWMFNGYSLREVYVEGDSR